MMNPRPLFSKPYTISNNLTRRPLRLLWSNWDLMLEATARRQRNPEDDPSKEGTLDLTIVLPDNSQYQGSSTDAQFLPTLAVLTERMCDRLNLGFHIKTRVSGALDV